MTSPQPDATVPSGKVFWLGAALGAATIGYALASLLGDIRRARLPNVAVFLAGAGVAHDFVWAPVVVTLGALTLAVPAVARLPVRAGLALSAVLTLFALPPLQGSAAHRANPTVLPLAYGRNLGVTLGVIWLWVAIWSGARLWRARRERATT